MPVWLPLIKVVLPYVGPIVQAALPAFTRKKGDPTVVAQQIAELQEAVRSNDESLKSLARAMEESAKANDAATKQLRLLAFASVLVAIAALLVAGAALMK